MCRMVTWTWYKLVQKNTVSLLDLSVKLVYWHATLLVAELVITLHVSHMRKPF